jgi:hypothetical protein
MSDLSVFQVTVTSYPAETDGKAHTDSRYVRAATFAEAIGKIETDFFSKLKLPERHFVMDVHAEWMPDLEDIIE